MKTKEKGVPGTPVKQSNNKDNSTMNAPKVQEVAAPTKRQNKLFSGSQIMEEMKRVSKVAWIIDDFFPQSANVSLLYGAPSSYKSFIALDIMLCIAHGLPYYGRETEQGSVVYIAAEGGAGLWKRIVAWQESHKLTEISDNFIVRDGGFNLHDKKELAALATEILEAGIKPKFIVIDTLARCFGDLDENSNAAMGQAIIACDILREKIGCKALIIHHSGKDKTKGARGGIALPCGVDTSFEVSAIGQKVCKVLVRKQKDAEDGKEFFYKMKLVTLDFQDLKGNQITSLVPELDNKLGAANKPFNGASGRKLELLTALQTAIEKSDTEGATEEQWRNAFYDKHGKTGKERTAFTENYQKLEAEKSIYKIENLYFLSNEK